MSLPDIHTLSSNDTMVLTLALCIAALFTAALLLLILTLFERKRKIKKEQLKKRYQDIINQSLFRFLFQNESGSILPEKTGTGNFSSSPLFQKVAIKSLVSLHQNYSGEYKEKLELYYTQSGLVQYSLNKLSSDKWERKVEGIRDLSNLRYMPALKQIRDCISHKHKMVRLEALGGVVKMQGLQELLPLSRHIYLNDWVQGNILFQVKSSHIPEPASLNEMLQSDNLSLQLMAVRLVDLFNSPKYTLQLQSLQANTGDEKLKSEIGAALSRLHSFYKNSL